MFFSYSVKVNPLFRYYSSGDMVMCVSMLEVEYKYYWNEQWLVARNEYIVALEACQMNSELLPLLSERWNILVGIAIDGLVLFADAADAADATDATDATNVTAQTPDEPPIFPE